MLTEDELGAYIDRRLTRSAFRLELLEKYDAESERADFARFLRGEAIPSLASKRAWLDRLKAETEAGIRNQRVHVLKSPLADYLRFECAWGYAYNADAGEDIRIIDLAERVRPSGLTDHDFWLIDDEWPIRMYYDKDGRFIGADPVDPIELPRYRVARDSAMTGAEPFRAWWHRHEQEHRAA